MALRALRTLRSLSRRTTSTFASLNGVPTPAASLKCSIWDVTFQRGDGVFEAVRVVQDRDGVPAPRAVGLHLDRLERSAAALELSLPPRAHLESWLRDAARNGGGVGPVETRRLLWYLTRRRGRPLPLDRPRWLLKLGTARPSGDPTILLIRGKRSGSATVRADTITMDLETIVCFMTDRLCAVQIKIKVSRAWAAQSTLLVM
mgnify:CR=1 FL=1